TPPTMSRIAPIEAWKSGTVALVKNERMDYPAVGEVRPRGFPRSEHVMAQGFRRLFELLGLDREKTGHPSWNPLREYIQPGMTVLLKPNWVREFNAGPSKDMTCMYTQPGVIRAVLDYVCLALDGRGKVIIGDAPLQSCNFDKLIQQSGLHELALE